MPAEDYPVIPTLTEGNGYLLAAEDLKHALDQVNIAAARNDIRPELSGVFFGFNGDNSGQLVLAATDSYRLAEKKIPLSQGKENYKVIVPGRTAQEMSHILAAGNDLDAEKSVRIVMNENQIAVNFNSVQLISRLVEGQYPDYVQIIPKDFKSTIEVPIEKLAKEVKAASLFSTIGVNAVSLEIEPNQGVKIASTSTQTGEYHSEIEAVVTGEKNSILLNHRYLLDGLNCLAGAVAHLKVINGDSPCVVKAKDDPSYLYIVMPIRQ